MKRIIRLSSLAVVGLVISCLVSGKGAEASQTDGKGTVGFTGEYIQEVYDPENPGVVVDPGESPQTDGKLRIDFVPQFRFGLNRASKEDASYTSYAQLFKSSVPARGTFVQVSDYRGTGSGWQLSMKQEEQFKNENGKTLDGTTIAINHSWANSTRDSSEAPIVKQEVIQMTVGNTQVLANATTDKGQGTWAINFGASATNSNGISDTLTPLVDEEGYPIVDPSFENKPIYLNSAIQLHVPGKAVKEPGTTYSTVITWTLSELP